MIVLKFWENVFGGMGSPAPLFQHMWKLDYFWTFSYDCTSFDYSQKLCLLIFDYFFVGHVIVNIGLVAWKCQIVKIWSFLEERNTVTIFYFFFNFLQTTDHFYRHHDLQDFVKYVPHFTELVLLSYHSLKNVLE